VQTILSCFIILLCVTAIQSDEPRLQGKNLNAWIRDLGSTDRDTVVYAASRISHLGPEAEAAVPALIKLLDSEDEYLRFIGVNGLADIGRKAVAGIPHLVKALDDEEDDVRLSAADALGRITPGIVDQQAFLYLDDLKEAENKIRRMRWELDPDTFTDSDILLPIRRAIDSLEGNRFRRRIGIALVLVVAVSVATVLGFVFRQRQLVLLGRRWNFLTDDVDYRITLALSGTKCEVAVRPLRGTPEVLPPVVLDVSQASRDALEVEALRRQIDVYNLLSRTGIVDVPKELEHIPWSNYLSGKLADDSATTIVGQRSVNDEARRGKLIDRRRICFAALACKDPGPGFSVLQHAGEEIITVSDAARKWGASEVPLPEDSKIQADPKHILSALQLADIVHICCHGSKDGLHLNRGQLLAPEQVMAIGGAIRTRLVVLSACNTGDMVRSWSLAGALLGAGVNTLAPLEEINDQAANEFFQSFYQAFLPRSGLQGAQLHDAMRLGNKSCFPAGLSGIRRSMWAKGLNSLVIYGDPTLQLRLV
tara:strand:+ start:47434 stop:49041 length:1608 start_codon:yes stop_codon:yes gene_type:complete